MKQETVERLLTLNYQFYQTFAVQFSSTRQRIQAGVFQLLGTLAPLKEILDLGCGNGQLASELARAGFAGNYTGLDFSPGLIQEAEEKAASIRSLPGFSAEYQLAHLSSPAWDSELTPGSYEAVLAFAVLHHLPGMALRREILCRVQQLLMPGGRFFHSHWQILNSPRLENRILPWADASMSVDELDPGDLLVDWRSGGSGLRYVHHFTTEELSELASETGFQIIEEFTSDGKEGNLSLYQVWRKL